MKLHGETNSSNMPAKSERRLDEQSIKRAIVVVRSPRWRLVIGKQHLGSSRLRFLDNDSVVYPVDVAQIPLGIVDGSPLESNRHIHLDSWLSDRRLIGGYNFIEHSHFLDGVCIFVEIFSRFSSSILHACPDLPVRNIIHEHTLKDFSGGRKSAKSADNPGPHYQQECKVRKNLLVWRTVPQTSPRKISRLHVFETPVFGLFFSWFLRGGTVDEFRKCFCIFSSPLCKMCIYAF